MKILDGAKTYLGGIGLILIGIGGILTHRVDYLQGATDLALGLIAVGARAFGQKILDAIKSYKP